MTATVIRRRPSTSNAVLPGDLHPLVKRVYAARGVNDGAQLDLSLERMLPLSELDGIADAVALLMAHRTGRVLVIGDFDADGATSTALVVRHLRKLGFSDVRYLVPTISMRLWAHAGIVACRHGNRA